MVARSFLRSDHSQMSVATHFAVEDVGTPTLSVIHSIAYNWEAMVILILIMEMVTVSSILERGLQLAQFLDNSTAFAFLTVA